METLESSRVCRLCGKHSGISINIFDKNESHVKKINAVLPIMVHEMDLLPKHMCHRCSYKLEEFHKFYVDCLKTDADLKSQLSWMRKGNSKERIDAPMVHIENLKIKIEPPEYDVYELDPIVENVNYINSMSSVAFPVNGVRQSNGIHDGIAYAAYAPRCDCYCDKNNQSRQAVPNKYENRTGPISRCTGGMNNPTTNALQAVKKNLFTEDNLIEKRQSNLSARRETKRRKLTTETKDTGSSTSTAMENSPGDTRIKNTIDSTNNSIVRNLRPRKGPIDYTGTKRKSSLATGEMNPVNRSKSTEIKPIPSSSVEFEISRVKIEKTEDFEGRTLRPRNKFIDYSTKRPWKSRSEGTYCVKRHKGNAEVTENDSTLFQTKKSRPDIKITIKREPLDFEDTPKPSKKSRTTTRVVRNLSQSVEGALPNNVHIMSDASEYSRSNEEKRDDFHLNAKPKSLTIVAKRRVRDSLKYLRSFDAHLRNGKVRIFDEIVEKKVKKLRKNLGCAKVSTDQLKLLENIKHYCEKCNLSFANKELYKLHACYD